MNTNDYHSFTASFQVGKNTCKYHFSSQPDPPSHKKQKRPPSEDESSKETMTKSSLKPLMTLVPILTSYPPEV